MFFHLAVFLWTFFAGIFLMNCLKKSECFKMFWLPSIQSLKNIFFGSKCSSRNVFELKYPATTSIVWMSFLSFQRLWKEWSIFCNFQIFGFQLSVRFFPQNNIDISRSHLLKKHFSILRWTLKITYNENKILEQPLYVVFFNPISF
jgi:hypothetical protein